ncbi:unnamed protein product [Leptidea sinapis]|uniref:Protein rolling stone n=1 Tax=Leptidea sinapis TaxID=189913 RepID=A0A5E4QXA5_9NEOP|nr:unnamed protein product [Leptidea sinapis]
MSALQNIKDYFKNECQLHMVGLEHERPSEFYLSAWQSTRSSTPLLVWRALLFLASLGIVLTSFIMYILSPIPIGFWFIYLTHWGLTIMLFCTGFAVAVSMRCYFYGPITGVSEEIGPVLDVSIHGVNSVIMFLLLASSAHASRLVHLVHPAIFACTYVQHRT